MGNGTPQLNSRAIGIGPIHSRRHRRQEATLQHAQDGRSIRRLLLILGLAAVAFPFVLYLRPVLLVLGALVVVPVTIAWAILRSQDAAAKTRLELFARPSIKFFILAYVTFAILDRLPGAAQPWAVLVVLSAAVAFTFYLTIARARELQTELQRIKTRVGGLAGKHPRQVDVAVLGTASGRTILETVYGVCEDATRALETGRDVNGQPITNSQVGQGLRRLVIDATHDLGVVATLLDPAGVAEFQSALQELERFAARLE